QSALDSEEPSVTSSERPVRPASNSFAASSASGTCSNYTDSPCQPCVQRKLPPISSKSHNLTLSFAGANRVAPDCSFHSRSTRYNHPDPSQSRTFFNQLSLSPSDPADCDGDDDLEIDPDVEFVSNQKSIPNTGNHNVMPGSFDVDSTTLHNSDRDSPTNYRLSGGAYDATACSTTWSNSRVSFPRNGFRLWPSIDDTNMQNNLQRQSTLSFRNIASSVGLRQHSIFSRGAHQLIPTSGSTIIRSVHLPSSFNRTHSTTVAQTSLISSATTISTLSSSKSLNHLYPSTESPVNASSILSSSRGYIYKFNSPIVNSACHSQSSLSLSSEWNQEPLQEDEEDSVDPLVQCGCVEMDDLKCRNSILCTVHTVEEKRRVHRSRDLRDLMREARQRQQALR
ncbi:unnamed protein product, partial [Protopolystoma xenopodis]